MCLHTETELGSNISAGRMKSYDCMSVPGLYIQDRDIERYSFFQVVMVGDQRQLGPVVDTKRLVDAGLGISLFVRFFIRKQCIFRLSVQYRYVVHNRVFTNIRYLYIHICKFILCSCKYVALVRFSWPWIRMHPQIASFPSRFFYDGNLQSGVFAEQRTLHFAPRPPFTWPCQEMPSLFIIATVGNKAHT